MDLHTLRVVEFDTTVSEKEGEKKYIAQHEDYKQEDWKTSTDGIKDETGDENQCLNDNSSPPGLSKKCLDDKISPPGTSKKYVDDTSSPPGTSKKYPGDKMCPPGTSEKYLDDTTFTSPPETSKKYYFAGNKSKSEIFKILPKSKPRKRDFKINSRDIGLTKLFQDSAHSHQKNRTFNLRNRNSRVHHKVENVKEKKGKNEEVHFLFARETPRFIKYCKKRGKNQITAMKNKRDSELPNDFYGFQSNRSSYFNFIDTDKKSLKKLKIQLHRKPKPPQPVVAKNCACKHHALRVLNSTCEIGESSIYYNLFTDPLKSQSKETKDEKEEFTKDKMVEVSSSSLCPVLKNSFRDASTGPSRVKSPGLCCSCLPCVKEKFPALDNVTSVSNQKLSALHSTPKPGANVKVTSESNQKLSALHTAKPSAAPAQNKFKKKRNHMKKTKLITNVPQGFISRFGMYITDFYSKKKRTGQKSCIEYVVFGLLIVVWSPCLLAVILAWVVMLPLKFKSTLKTDKSKRFGKKDARSEYQRMFFENYMPKNKRSFMTSATNWYTRTVGTVVNTLTSLLKLKKKAPTGAGSSFLPASYPNPRKRYTLFYADNRGWVMKPLRRRNTRSFASSRVVQSMRCEGRSKLRCPKHLPQKLKKVCPCPVHGDDSYSRHTSSAAGDACPLQFTSWEKYSKASSMFARHEPRYHRRQQVNIPTKFCYSISGGTAFNSTDKIINAKHFNSNDIADNVAHEDLAKYHLGQRKNGTLPFGVVFNHPRGTKHPLITNLETYRAHKFGLAGKTLNMSKKSTPRLVIKGLQGHLPKCWTKHEAGKAVNKTHGVPGITNFTGFTTSMPQHISSYRQNTKREEALNSLSGRNHKSAINNKKLQTLQLNYRNKCVLVDIPKSTGTKQANTNTYKINYAHKTQNTSKHILCHKVTHKPKKAEIAKPDMASKCAKHTQPKQALKYKTDNKTRVPTQKLSSPAKIKSSMKPDIDLIYSFRNKHKQSEQGYKYNQEQIPLATHKQLNTAEMTTSTHVALNCPCGEKHQQSTQANKYKPHKVPVATQKQLNTADIMTSTNVDIALNCPCGEKREQSTQANKYKPHKVPVATQKQLNTADIMTSTNVDIALNCPCGEKREQSTQANKYKPHKIPVSTQKQLNTADIMTSTNVDIAVNYPYEEKHEQYKYCFKNEPHQSPVATQMQSRTADNTTMTNLDIGSNYLYEEKHEQYKHGYKYETYQIPNATQMQSTTAENTTMTNRDIALNCPCEEKHEQHKNCCKNEPYQSPVAIQMESRTADNTTMTKRGVALNCPYEEKHEHYIHVYKEPHQISNATQMQSRTADNTTMTNYNLPFNYLGPVKPSTANKKILCISSTVDTICTQDTRLSGSAPKYIPETRKPEQSKQYHKYIPDHIPVATQKQSTTADTSAITDRDVALSYPCGEKQEQSKQVYKYKHYKALNYLGAVKPSTANKEILCIPSTADKNTTCIKNNRSPEYISKKQDISIQKQASKIETSVYCASDYEGSKTKELIRPEQSVFPKKTVDCTSCCASTSCEKTGLSNQTSSLKKVTNWGWGGELGGSTKLNGPCLYKGTQTASLIPQENKGKVENERAFTKKMVDYCCGAKPKSIATATEFPSERQADKNTFTHTQYPFKQQILAIDCGLDTEQNLNTFLRESFSTSRTILANRTEDKPTKQPLGQKQSLVARALQIRRVSTTQPLSTRQLQTDELLNQFQPHANSPLFGMSSDSRYGLAPRKTQVLSVQASSSQYKIARDCRCGVTPQQNEPDKQMEKIPMKETQTPALKKSSETPPTIAIDIQELPSRLKAKFQQHLPGAQTDIPKEDTTLSKIPKSPENLASKISQATSTLFGIASDCLCGVTPQIGEASNPQATKTSLGTDGQPEFSQHLPSVQPDIPKVDKTLSKFPKSPEHLASKISQATSTLFGIASDCLCGVTPQIGQASNPPATKTSVGTDGQPKFSQHLPSMQPDIPKVDKTLSKLPKSLEHLLSKVSQATSPVFGIASNCHCGVTPQQNTPDKQMKQITMKETETPALPKSSETPQTTATDIQEFPCDCTCECNSESRLNFDSKKTNTHKTSSAKAPPSQQSKLTQAPSHTLQEQTKLFGIASDCPCRRVTSSKSHAAKETVKSLQEPIGEQSYYTKRYTTKSKFSKSPDHSLLPKSLPHKCWCRVDIPQDPVGEQPYGTNVSKTLSERNIVKVDKTRSKFPKSPDHSPPPKSLPRKCRCPVETLLAKSLPHKCRCPVDIPQYPVGEQRYGTKVCTTSSERNIVKADKTRSKFPKSPDHSPSPKSLPRKCRCPVETLLAKSLPHKCRCPVDTLQDPVGEQPYDTKVRTTSSERNIVKVDDKTQSNFPKSLDHSPPPKSLPRKCRCPVETLLPKSLPHKCRCLVDTLQDPVGEQPYDTKVRTTSSERNIVKVDDKTQSNFPKSLDHSPPLKSLPRKCRCPVETLLPKSLPHKCRCLVDTLQDPVGEQPYDTKVRTTSSERNIVKVDDKTQSNFPRSLDHSPPPKSLPRKCRCPVETLLPKSLPHKCRCLVNTLQDPVGEQLYDTKVRTTSSERNIVIVDKTRLKFSKSPAPPPKLLPHKCLCPVETPPHECPCPVDTLQNAVGEHPYGTKVSTTSSEGNIVKVDHSWSKFPKSPDYSPHPKSRKCRCLAETPRKCRCLAETLQDFVGEPSYGTKVRITPSKRKSVKVDKTRSKFSQSREHSPPQKNLLQNRVCPVETLQDSVGKKTSQSSRKSVFSRKSLDFPQRCPCSSSHNNIDTCPDNEPYSRVPHRSKVSRLVLSLRCKLFSRKNSKQTKIPENPTEKPRSWIFSFLQVNPTSNSRKNKQEKTSSTLGAQTAPIIQSKCTCWPEKLQYLSNKLSHHARKSVDKTTHSKPPPHLLNAQSTQPDKNSYQTRVGTEAQADKLQHISIRQPNVSKQSRQPEFFQHLGACAQPNIPKIDSLHLSSQSKQLTEKVEKQFDAIPQQPKAEKVIPIISGKCSCAGEQKMNTEYSSSNKLQPNTDLQKLPSIQPSRSPNSHGVPTDKRFPFPSASIISGKCRCAREQKVKTECSSNSKLQQIQLSHSPNSHRIVDYQSVDNQRFKTPIASHPTRKSTLGTDKQPEFSQHLPNQPLETPALSQLQPSQQADIPHRAPLHNSQPMGKKPCKLYPSSKHGNEQEIPKSLYKIANAQCPGMSHYSTEKFQKSHLSSCVYPVTAKKKRLKHVIILQRSEISQTSGNPQFQVYQQNLPYQKLLSQIPINLDKTPPGLLQQYSPGLGRTGSVKGGVQQPYPDFNRVSMRYPGHNPGRKQSEPIHGPYHRPPTNNYPPAPRATPPPKLVSPKSRYDESALRRAYKRRPLRYIPYYYRQQLSNVDMEKKLKENKKNAVPAEKRKSKWCRKNNIFQCLRDLINQTEREAWPHEITCHALWVNSLKHRPCFWIYKLFPRLYPAFLNCYKYQQYSGQTCVYILTLCFWSPLLMCGYFCCKGCC